MPSVLEMFEALKGVKGVVVWSDVLQEEIWVAADENFKKNLDDERVVYYDHELRHLSRKTHDELQQIHRIKKLFPDSKVRK